MHHFPHHSFPFPKFLYFIQNFLHKLEYIKNYNFFFWWLSFCPGFSSNPKTWFILYLFILGLCDLTAVWFTECLEQTQQILLNVCCESIPMMGTRNINTTILHLIIYHLYIISGICWHILIEFSTSPQNNVLHFLRKLKTKYQVYSQCITTYLTSVYCIVKFYLRSSIMISLHHQW